jgi:hypothetical protein
MPVRRPRATGVEPAYEAEIKYSEIAEDGELRHAWFNSKAAFNHEPSQPSATLRENVGFQFPSLRHLYKHRFEGVVIFAQPERTFAHRRVDQKRPSTERRSTSKQDPVLECGSLPRARTLVQPQKPSLGREWQKRPFFLFYFLLFASRRLLIRLDAAAEPQRV